MKTAVKNSEKFFEFLTSSGADNLQEKKLYAEKKAKNFLSF